MTVLLAGCLATMTSVGQQPSTCPPPPAARPCEAFHYHVSMYRPDTKTFTEITAVPQFATQAACDRAREQRINANLRVVEFFQTVKKDQRYLADRVGACHCDMTTDKSSVTYLTDAQRTLQLRNEEETRLRVRERLLDNGLTTGSEAVQSLWNEPPPNAMLAGPKLAPLPQAMPVVIATSPEDLEQTKSLDTTKPTIAALDLPLIDVEATPPPEPSSSTESATSEQPAPTNGQAPAAPAEAPIETVEVPAPVVETPADPQPEQVVNAQDAPTEEDVVSAQETAERFINYETQRIQNVLRASAAIADETVKSKIFEACMQRIQLLSNLRLLIEGSGMRSSLAAAARKAETESDRLAVITRLFGDDIAPHWAPRDAADVIFEVENDVASAPERALRDTTGRFTAQQKKRALYLVLAQTQPTEDQRLWLGAVVEGFLR